MSLHVYHYYEASVGPFKNLSSLSSVEANEISERIRESGKTFASRRTADYMNVRKELEAKARTMFIDKGGKPISSYPHYMTLGACDWLLTWYSEPAVLHVSLDELPEDQVSFTYGDLFPTMRFRDLKPYRGQVYTKKEILKIIDEYGFPQKWNQTGEYGPERYIEMQIWDEQIVRLFRSDGIFKPQEEL